MSKRSRAIVLSFFFFLSSVFPVRQANAFAPLVIAGAELVGAAGGASVFTAVAGQTAGYFAAGFAGALGLLGGYLAIKDAQDNYVRIPVSSNAGAVVPSPAAPASAPSVTAPGQYCVTFPNPGYGSYVSGTFCGASPDAACSAGGSAWYYNSCHHDYYGSAYQPGYVSSGAPTCPAGYSMSSGVCALTNSRQVVPDKKCDMLLAGGSFAMADDLDCPATVSGKKLSPMIRDGKAIAYGTNSSGQPLMFTVTPGPQTFQIQIAEQTQTATQTQVQTTSVSVDALSGQITAVQTATAPGSISSPGSASVPTTTNPLTDPTAVTNTPTVTVDGTKPAVTDIKFPTDYARQGEAQTAANSLKNSLDSNGDKIKTAIENGYKVEDATLVDPDIKAESELTDSFFKTTFNPLLGWTVPGHASQCPTADLSFTMFGHYTPLMLNAHCSIFESVRGVLSTTMIVVWVVVAMFIVLGA